jgi:hypothetical protein
MNRRIKLKAPVCLCGCDGQTKGGRFLPGHDAKLKKVLMAAARAGKKRAANKLQKLGWSKFLRSAPSHTAAVADSNDEASDLQPS